MLRNCAIINGRLYDLETAMTACPAGYHLSTDEEWAALVDYAGGDSTAGTKLKSKRWKRPKDVPAGTDAFGFSALQGGIGLSSGGFLGLSGTWWSDMENGTNTRYRTMYYYYESVTRDYGRETLRCSVRCVADKEEAEMKKAAIVAAVVLTDCVGKETQDKPVPPDDTPGVAPDTDTTFTDRRDGKVYRKVEINGQVWMAENLNYETKGSVCYKNSEDSCAKYGRLYNWYTATKACPAGFHLACDKEWTALVDFAGGAETAGTKLNSSTGWKIHWGIPAGTNEYGFSALPGGLGESDGKFYTAGVYGYWWSAAESGADSAWGRNTNSYDGNVGRGNIVKTDLFSARCVKD